jgi:hypothetical protein
MADVRELIGISLVYFLIYGTLMGVPLYLVRQRAAKRAAERARLAALQERVDALEERVGVRDRAP